MLVAPENDRCRTHRCIGAETKAGDMYPLYLHLLSFVTFFFKLDASDKMIDIRT